MAKADARKNPKNVSEDAPPRAALVALDIEQLRSVSGGADECKYPKCQYA